MDETDLSRALALHQQGDLDAALDIYRRLIDAVPDQPDAWHLSGAIAHQRGDHVLAQRLIEQAIALNQNIPDYHNNFGLALGAQGLTAEAAAAFERTLCLDPAHLKALINFGGLERRRGNLSAAVSLGRRAVEAAPGDHEAHSNLGNALKDFGDIKGALEAYRRAIEIAPDFALGHWNLALALLLAGELQEGFAEFAWRWRWDGFPGVRREFDAPLWRKGDDVAGKTVLLYVEQGLGDTLQFLRYVPMVIARGAAVILEVPAAIAPLAAGFGAEIRETGSNLLPFDLHAPLLDLPAILGTTAASIPAPNHYLSVPTSVEIRWRERLAPAVGLKVGLNWSGNPESPVEKFRCLPLDQFQDLAAVDDVIWYSLQKGPDGTDTALPPAEFQLIDTGIEPLVETAGLIGQMDLVITSDTAVAHLSAALGRPTWVLLHAAPDWRWGLSGDNCAWYPTVRLFRQPSLGDWSAVAAAVTSALVDWAVTKISAKDK